MAALETGRPYFSIGEVLNVLKDSFPDVTVSKIRFLESEGLIQPERTSSGYRKFTEQDIDRLRFILKLQRDQFLPLKVIRERLDELDSTPDAAQARLGFEQLGAEPEVEQGGAASESIAATGLSLSLTELASASGLSPEQIDELTSFRMLDPTQIREERDGAAGETTLRFDEHDLESAKLCRALLDLGLEPRHLRVFRMSADRWADLAEQMASPFIRQRNPEARRQAQDKVRELLRVGAKLVRVLLREEVEPLI